MSHTSNEKAKTYFIRGVTRDGLYHLAPEVKEMVEKTSISLYELC